MEVVSNRRSLYRLDDSQFKGHILTPEYVSSLKQRHRVAKPLQRAENARLVKDNSGQESVDCPGGEKREFDEEGEE